MQSLSENSTLNIFKYVLEIEGKIRHYEARMAQLPMDKNIMTIIRDVSEQVSYEQKLIFQAQLLKQKKQELETIFQEAPNPMGIHNEDGEVLMINKVWEELTGYYYKEINTVEKWTKKAYGKRMSVVKEYIDTLYDVDQKIDSGQFDIITKGGDIITWQIYTAPLGVIDGKRTIISSAMDNYRTKTQR